jgi:DNA-dependent RNA polymerase auxiliary subunit epsilon
MDLAIFILNPYEEISNTSPVREMGQRLYSEGRNEDVIIKKKTV